MKPLIIGLSYDMKTIFFVFCFHFFGGHIGMEVINLGDFGRTVTKFPFPYKPFNIYARLFTLKLSLACLFISLMSY